MSLEQTLVILKPDALERKLVGKIITRFEEAGLRIIRMKKIFATPAQLKDHFPNTNEWIRSMGERACTRLVNELGKNPADCFGTDDPFEVGMKIADGCREYYASGHVVALVLEGTDAVRAVRKLLGNTLPSKAEPGTIRGDFGEKEDMGKLVIGAARNLVHASDSVEEAEREIAVWFPEEPRYRLTGKFLSLQ